MYNIIKEAEWIKKAFPQMITNETAKWSWLRWIATQCLIFSELM